MIECESIAEAMKVNGVIHIEAGSPARAYVQGDELPQHCKIDPSQVDPPSEMEKLKERIAALEAKVK